MGLWKEEYAAESLNQIGVDALKIGNYNIDDWSCISSVFCIPN